MKKSRKVLSVILAIALAFASMPMVYTAAAETVAYSLDSGTIDNPTTNVKKEGNIEREDLYKVNLSVIETTYHFYQRVDDEYFTFTQAVGFQQVNSGATDRTLTFDSVSDYTGGTNLTDSSSDEAADGTQGYYENPAITENNTADFLKNSQATTEWIPINENAKSAVSGRTDLSPANFQIEGSTLDLSGCKVYTWHNKVVFKGSAAGESSVNGTHTYYRSYKYHWVSKSDSLSHAEMDARVGTTINVVDAREFYKQLVKVENILDYPAKYTDAYISSVTATYNSIPEDLKDFSALYTQEEVDAYAQSLKDISKNSADYSVYNEYYEQLSALDNHTGSWTDESFAAFKAEIANIDANLPKNLDKTYQSTVDAAVQALVDAYNNILISTDLSTENVGASYTEVGDKDVDGNMSYTVDNTAFKFMQTKDNQVFQYSQQWTMTLSSGDVARYFGGMTLETSYPLTCESDCLLMPSISANNTQEYINHLTSDSYANITADNENGDSTTAPEFTCWWEYQSDGTANTESTFVDSAGTLNQARDFAFAEGKTYYLKNSPKITGNPAGTYGELNLQYVLRTGWNWKTGGLWGWLGTDHYAHIHVNNTIEITDVRQLITAEAAAQEILANPDGYSDGYITALEAAVSSVPQYMLYGSEYYTQDVVDSYTTAITSVMENPDADYADYTEFNKVFADLSATENEGQFTSSSFDAFQDAIFEINTNLDKNLPSSEQDTVDEAVEALFAAEELLQYRHLNEDKEFTNKDITDSLGNNPVEFSVSSTEYKFMQTHDGQEFVIKTDLTMKNTRSSYTSKLLSLKISQLDANSLDVCANRSTPDTGCHYGENVLVNNYQTLLNSVTNGVNVFDTANEAGDIAEFNTWVNNYGNSLSSGGVITDGVELSTSDSSASATMIYTGATGGAENLTATTIDYALRLGWSYQEVVLSISGDNINRHAHIPVTLTITDARALNTLYKESMNAVLGKTDETYTLATLEALYDTLSTIPTDMAYGDAYYTQEQVNEAYERLNASYTSLKEGADYSEYFKEHVNAEDILATNNTDAYGNKLYTDEAYNEYKETVEAIMNGLDRNLDATEENQATIDAATQALKDAEATLNENKYADYESFEEALEKANDILNAPEGTYTDETIESVQAAVDNANNVSKDLPESEQATVDSATDLLESAVEDSLFRADYTEYEEALAKALAITNDDNTYTNSAYAAYLEKLAAIDSGLDKNLPDYAVNRQIISAAIDEINAAIAELENNRLGDYSAYDEAKATADAIVNDDGNGNEVYNPEAFEQFKNTIENIDANLNRDLSVNEQSVIDTATQSIKDAQATLEDNKWADYSELDANKALVQEILDAPEGTYTDATVQAAQNAMNTANQIPEGLVVGKDNVYQNQIDAAADGLKTVLDNAKEKADYSEFDKVSQDEKLQEIINAPEGTYTDATVQAATDALAAADALDKDLPKEQQSVIDDVTNALQNAIDNAQIKADYSEFNDVKAELEEIVNAPEGTYTDATVQAATDALKQAEDLDRDLPDSQQSVIDAVTDAMQNVIDNAEEKADYTDYNDKKSELEQIIANGNTDPDTGKNIYAPEVFEKLQESLDNIDNNLDKDLPITEQETVDNATDSIQSLIDAKLYTATFVDTDLTTVLNTVEYTNGTLLKDIAGVPTLPENTEAFVYAGWITADDVIYTDESVVKGDITLYLAGEYIKLVTKEDSEVKLDEVLGYVTGVDKNTTVSQVKAELENDETYVEIKDYTGAELESTALVGTGSTITLKSRFTGAIYEQKTILVYGDVDGDGDVDDADYSKARAVNVGEAAEEYTIDGVYREYFFLANDLNGDGYIDVLDTSLLALVKNGKRVIK